ncbi:MAG: peptidylprolyl isomerase, partial [Chloroflexota bacterium]|nr:peptidylprolyl isomerase [Chloroflexota bacterium]
RTPARPAPRGLTRPISNALDKAGLARFSTGRYLAIWAGVIVVILATLGVLVWAGVSSARSVTPLITPTPLSGAVLTGTVVTVETSKGAFKITLDAENPALKATIRNFRAKVASGFYDGKLFHRVLPTLAQGGDPTCTPAGGPGCGNGGGTLNGEYVDTPFDAGSVGMASVAQRGLQVNDSQWFISKQAAPTLTGNYPRFGKVTAGMDVVNKLVGCTYKDTQVDSCAGADKMLKVTLGSK